MNLQVNQSNVTQIKINYTWSKAFRNNVMIVLSNEQSIKGKDLLLKDLLCEYNIDACIIMNTWLRDNEEGTAWTQLSKTIMSTSYTSPTVKTVVGGLALVTKQGINITVLASGTLTSFEYAQWMITVRRTNKTISAIYHLPYSPANNITNAAFLDE